MGRVGRTPRTVPPGYKLVPPDGGWAWVVLAGTVLTGTMIAIPLTAFGMLLKDMIVELDTSTTIAAWIPSLCVSVSMLISPFNGMLISSYSCRTASTIGGLSCSFGMILSYFANSVGVLYITFGIFVGAGLGMVTNSGFIVLSQYFKKRYGLATGINIASFAVGRLIFAPIVQWMLETIDIWGVFLICGGLSLNIVVGSAVFQPVDQYLILVPVGDDVPSAGNEPKATGDDAMNKKPISSNNNDVEVNIFDNSETLLKRRVNGSVSIPNSTTDIFKFANSHDAQFGSVTNVAALLSTSTVAPPVTVDGEEEDINLSSEEEDVKEGSWTSKKRPKNDLSCLACGPFKSINFLLLKEPILYLLLASGTVGFIAAVYVGVFMPSLGIENGLPPMEVAVVVSCRAGSEVVGRILAPFLFEQFHLNLNTFFIALMAVHGVLLIVLVFMTSVASMICIGILSGLIFGGVTGLGMVNIVDCVGVAQLSSALGITQFLQSFLSLGIGPLIGYFRDATGSYALCFYFLAGSQFFSCLIWAFKSLAIRKSNLEFPSPPNTK